jgi:hypothetical protein
LFVGAPGAGIIIYGQTLELVFFLITARALLDKCQVFSQGHILPAQAVIALQQPLKYLGAKVFCCLGFDLKMAADYKQKQGVSHW